MNFSDDKKSYNSFESKKRKEFINIVIKLSQIKDLTDYNENKLEDLYNDLENIYYIDKDEFFRHYYSDIFTCLTQIKQNNTNNGGDFETLNSNIQFLYLNYIPKNNDKNGCKIDITVCLRKLYDHISLDMARMNYIDESNDKTDIELKRIMKFINTNKNVQQKIEKELEDSKKEYITILGIFSSVVLAFTGGMVFSTSVLDNMDKISVYRLFFVIIIVGMILFNLIFSLLFYINNILNKKISYIPIIVFNLTVILLLGCIYYTWNNGVVENRDIKFSKQILIKNN